MAVLHSLPKNEEEVPVDVAAWLSDVPSDLSTPDTPTKPSCKRKRSQSLHEPSAVIQLFQRTRNPYKALKRTSFTKADLRNLRPSRSVPETPIGFSESSSSTISASPTQSSKKRKSSNGPLETQTDNFDNVRIALGKQGLRFEDEKTFDKYPEFQAKIYTLVCKDRGRVVSADSAKKIKEARKELATVDEATYYSKIVPMVIKDVDAIINEEFQSLAKKGLACRKDHLFKAGILPKFVDDVATKVFGLKTSKADCVYALAEPQFPLPGKASTSFIQNLIGVAPGMKHAFFAVENKSASGSIEDAENQAIRAGANMVNAFRSLLKAAAVPREGSTWPARAADEQPGAKISLPSAAVGSHVLLRYMSIGTSVWRKAHRSGT